MEYRFERIAAGHGIGGGLRIGLHVGIGRIVAHQARHLADYLGGLRFGIVRYAVHPVAQNLAKSRMVQRALSGG